MKRLTLGLLLVALLTAFGTARAEQTTDGTANPQVVFETSEGRIVIELDAAKAPLSTANFLAYVDADFFAGTIFHRVIPGFMIQGGGFTADMSKKPTEAGVKNEAKNGLKNLRGTIAMARTSDPHSATAQFYVNLVDNASLDYPSSDGWGYAVIGRVIEGMEAVDTIAGVKTGVAANGMRDVPRETVLIEGASRAVVDGG